MLGYLYHFENDIDALLERLVSEYAKITIPSKTKARKKTRRKRTESKPTGHDQMSAKDQRAMFDSE